MTDLKHQIEASLAGFKGKDLKPAALAFLNTLGYRSEKVLDLENAPAAFLAQFDHRDRPLRKDKALFGQWKSVEFLFQLTDDEIRSAGGQNELAFDSSAKVDYRAIHSYLILALDLNPGHYTRAGLAAITREINRLFDMPTLILFRYDDLLTFSVIDRRLHKRDQARDVLEKITLIKDIRCVNPHRAHVEILSDLALPVLYDRRPFSDFVGLHDAWREALNDRFYRRIREWFFLATQHVKFPHGGIADENIRNRTGLIRLLTRLVFCWFAKEKDLVPEALFKSETADRVLKKFDPASLKDGSYYKAILQNLFFPTLGVPRHEREFREGHRSPRGRNDDYMNHAVFRHKALFRDPKEFGCLFDNIPFLNGGLFECLDYRDERQEKSAEIRVDGFSDIPSKQPLVPNALFFGQEMDADLSEAYGSHKKAHVKVDGLFHILNAYKFTVAENTPVEQEIALDPELLGRIFEELLAEYSFDTEAAARKATGSFYTPRTVVNYMVDASLTAYLAGKLAGAHPRFSLADAEQIVADLIEWSETKPDLTEAERQTLADAIYDITVIDPACGSGAFPMGILQKLVHVLNKLDFGHERWKERILADIPVEVRDENRKMLETGSVDFNWKLGLILHCIYGIDIQPIAVQIAKLRCFIALLVDFVVDRNAGNFGVPPLPNLDFKFVAANSLIRPPGAFQSDGLALEDPFFTAFSKAAEDYFFIRDPEKKKKLREGIETLVDAKIAERERQVKNNRDQLVGAEKTKKHQMDDRMKRGHEAGKKKLADDITRAEREMSIWESYRNIFAYRNQPVLFFDTPYFFPEIKTGFDIVIGNPPYLHAGMFKDQKPDLKNRFGDFFDGTADIYTYFYKFGYDIMKSGGVLAFISSNKFMRSGYGSNLRTLLSKQAELLSVVDFGELPVFGAATDPAIIVIRKTLQKHDGGTFRAVVIKDPFEIANVAGVMAQRGTMFNTSSLPSKEWSFVAADVRGILNKISSVGKPLGEYCNNKFYYGIKTGLNEAFVVDRAARDRLIAEHSALIEKAGANVRALFKPWLDGNEMLRWRAEFSEQYLIALPSSGNLQWTWSIAGSDKEAETIFQETFPSIYRHLRQWKSALKKRADQGKFWWELRACSYWPEFDEEKIIFNETSKKLHAFVDDRKYYINKTGFMIVSQHNRFLLGLLNSSLLDFLYRHTFPSWGDSLKGGRVQFRKDRMIDIPIPAASTKDRSEIEGLVERVLSLVREKTESAAAQIRDLEQEIDARVHRLYGLTPEEIEIVDPASAVVPKAMADGARAAAQGNERDTA
ncbi:MAG: Eco57I restriction-modification methylase domain-containing protein [Patescibacteria group bacterium]